MNLYEQRKLHSTRREFFGKTAMGLGTAALASLMSQTGLANSVDRPENVETKRVGGLPDLPHFRPKAKRVIAMLQNGAPSHVDLFDWKPQLAEMHGKPVPDQFIEGKRFSTMTGKADGKLMLATVGTVSTAWPKRCLGQRPTSLHSRNRGRVDVCQRASHRFGKPCTRNQLPFNWRPSPRSTDTWCLDELWSRIRS